MRHLKFLSMVFSILIPSIVHCQSIYYSFNGSTNPNDINSWTKDKSGATLLLPPSNFTNPLDTFAIDGENLLISADWIVAGEVRLLAGSINDNNRYKFRAKKLAIYGGESNMHIDDDDDVQVGTLFIGPNGLYDVANIGFGNSIQVDDSIIVQGKLYIIDPMVGAGKFILKDGGTLQTTNGGLSKTGSSGCIQVTGSRYYSKAANYKFISNVGTFYTGDGLPDTIASLTIDNGDATTTILSSSTTVTGSFSSAGAWGGSNNNSYILLGNNSLKCLGNISITGGVTINGTAQSAFIISGNNNSSFSLLSMAVDSLVIDRPATITLTKNITAVSKLNLIKGIIRTGNYILQLGTSSEGSLYQTQGRIVGTYATFKNNVSTTPILFPVGTDNYPAFLTISYVTPPTSDGLLKVSYIDGVGTNTLTPSIPDGENAINYYSKFYWRVEPVIISGGKFNVSLDLKDITGLNKSNTSTLLLSDDSGSSFYVKGDRYPGSDILVNRVNLSGSDAFGKYYVGGDNTIPTSINDYFYDSNSLQLQQNYPNPFSRFTFINYCLNENSFVSLKVYNIQGEEIADLVGKEQSQGYYEVNFDGYKFSNGIYFYKLKTKNSSITKKMYLLK